MAARADPLARYNAKRDFAKTREPPGKSAKSAKGRLFMVQKHDATRLHWDLRLELDGVLKSWAVTRGPSLDPADKRLAVRTEDHPLAYATFEGTIPQDEYGGGTVMLWDRGTWTPVAGKDPRKTLAEGHLHFILDGERMKGEWLLVRMKPRPKEKGENWLLRKIEDQCAAGGSTLVDKALTSIDTGRTMSEIAEGKKAPQRKTAAKASTTAKAQTTAARPSRRSTAGKPPRFRDVQLATLVDHVPSGAGWLHEAKYDGYRALVAFGGGAAKAYTRAGLDWSDRFAPIVEAAAKLPGSGLLDGEVVALDSEGRPSFSTLQNALKAGGKQDYFVFDLLEQDGADLTRLANVERKSRLAALLKDVPPPIHYAEHIVGAGEAMFAGICRQGLEGVVSKRADAPYRGRRTQSWLKIKCTRRQEFVIIGWTVSDKGRGFRSLLLAANDAGALRYVGKVGTGFDAAKIEMLTGRMGPLEQEEPPVEIPRAIRRGAHWIKPKLVAEIAFAEFTQDNILRHASFVDLREDKAAKDVVVEKPKAAPAGDAPLFGVKISNPDRILYPESGITKGQLAGYYAEIADLMLSWCADRPVSLVRCPQGRAKQCFFQKHDAGSFGEAVHHIPIREKDGSVEPYLYLSDAAGLMTCVQMGTIEFHGWGAKTADVEKPDRLIFDLDPDEGLDFADVRRALRQLHEVLAGIGLVSFPLLTGGKGVHVVVPLDATVEWPSVKDFANRFALALAEAHPDRFTANLKKVQRRGRIFIDWLRNQRGATAVMPYSARARPNAPVAAPITWDEADDFTPNHFTVKDGATLVARARSAALRDWGVAKQRLPDF